MPLLIAVPKETKPLEKRVALTPDTVKQLKKAGGFECLIETGAGEGSYMADSQYQEQGASIATSAQEIYSKADILLKVNPPTADEVKQMKEGSILISFIYGYTQPELIKACLEKKITVFGMDAVPRISRAQKMDALSSQANLAGYKSVLLGANALGKIFPLMMTAAGTITPAKVLIFGAGVAGLQAIATAKRLGAVVEATDVRPETKEQVESLGGRFLQVEGEEGVQTEGGYAKEVSAAYLQKQKELVAKHVAEADIVITTALVIGKKAPMLVTEDMLKDMKAGSVVVDMAVESGGNCQWSQKDETVVKEGITIIGESNIPSLLPVNASELYAKNIITLLLHLAPKGELNLDFEEDVNKGSVITHNGELKHELTKKVLGL